jgi:hypothetical protein
MVSTVQVRYVYGTSLVLKQKCGLEFEREYKAILEGYMYVYYIPCKVLSVVYTMHCTLAWSWSGRIFNQRCRIRYCYTMYNIVNEQYYTAFRTTATSNIATVAYRTRTLFNT